MNAKDDDQHRRRDQGTTPLANYQKLAPVTDTFLFDIKQIDSNHHKTLFGIGNEGVRRNLEWLVDLGPT